MLNNKCDSQFKIKCIVIIASCIYKQVCFKVVSVWEGAPCGAQCVAILCTGVVLVSVRVFQREAVAFLFFFLFLYISISISNK